MSWTYSGDPSTSPLDEVRALIGDTDADNPVLSNEEINFPLTMTSNTKYAAIKCCEYIIAKCAQDVDFKIGPELVHASQRVENYKELLRTLYSSYSKQFAAPIADVSEDRLFEVGMFDCGW